MEFSKHEKRLLDSRFPARNRVVLIIGIAFVAISLLFLVFGGRLAERVRRPYQHMLLTSQDIVTQSEREELIKQSVLETVKAGELGWHKYAEAVHQEVFLLLFIFGVVLIGIYRQNLCVYCLLKKLGITS
jgi:hypothetical protein